MDRDPISQLPLIFYCRKSNGYNRIIGIAGGAVGAPAPPRAVKKNFRHNLQGKCVSAPPGHEVHPPPEQESILGQFLLGGLDLDVYLDVLCEGDD